MTPPAAPPPALLPLIEALARLAAKRQREAESEQRP
jgi:hypothetical protein